MSPVSVIIADDHPIFRRGLRDTIESSEHFSVVGEAEDGGAAMARIDEFQPRLAVIDLAMPGADGFAVTSWAGEHHPETMCVIMTMYTEQAYLERAVDLGAYGFLVKDDAQSDLIRCLELVDSGEFYLSPSVGTPRPRPPSPDTDPADLGAIDRLTPAQREILRQLSQYKTSKEIARTLNVSPKTVENHRLNISSELELHGRNKLLQFAVRTRHLL